MQPKELMTFIRRNSFMVSTQQPNIYKKILT
jgi:hypothetical protein